MQKQGILKQIKVRTGEEYHIGTRERIMVLSGTINHVTGTASDVNFYIFPNSGAELHTRTQILAALTSAEYPLFNTASEETQAQTPVIIMKEKDCITFDGGALSYVSLLVIVWQRP